MHEAPYVDLGKNLNKTYVIIPLLLFMIRKVAFVVTK